MATAICVENEVACAAAECTGGGIEKLDLGGGDRKAGVAGGGKRSVYLMDCAPVWGCASTRGRSAEMEDACAAAPRFADVPVRLLASRRDLDGLGLDADALRLPAHLFGVFDGHGGAEVANYCRERLQVLLSKELRQRGKDLVEMGEVDMKEHWDELFRLCFQRVDDEVSGRASRLIDGVEQCLPVAPENVGSTVVVAIVCSSHVVVANCGDSRSVLCRGKEPVPLSIDHKPDRKDERARIEAQGGKVIQWNGYRVSGILAMSRSIGDRYWRPFIIPKPEVMVVPRAKDDDCLILASDGLWDVMSNEEACKVARRQIQLWHKNNSIATSLSDEGDGSTDPAAQAAADYLMRLALKKGTEDNITVIVVDLKPRKKLKNNS
ncbi:protein phosphatase 2C 50-like [Phragmites australis]|uniref:protein phosphatase 2C 50-like n=1 Tax=Phragmites australis TaxID=29695 RepID=UPI002D76F398|nr:protein phosphatase 2C 50-like [Phragmites australis]